MHVYSFSDKGPRPINEDSFCVEDTKSGLLLAVADGVGGNQGGEVASHETIEALKKGVRKGISLKDCTLDAHKQIKALAKSNSLLMGMASTLTAVLIHEGRLTGVHCGDSRAYVLRGRGLQQLSEDHTEVAELLASGRISKREALDYPRKNIITSAVGSQKALKFHSFEFKLDPGDRILLLTDGVYSLVSKREIVEYSLNQRDFQRFCEQISNEVINIGPSDNFTLIGMQVC